MEQTTNVQNRAEKEYKGCREKFYFLLREIISNSFHSVLIRKDKEKAKGSNYSPKLILNISFTDKNCVIELEDNGEGFTKINSECFDELDKKNTEKVRYNFHPLGQGRLAIVFFADSSIFETVFLDDNDELKKKKFPYPDTQERVYSLSLFDNEETPLQDTYTKLIVQVKTQQKFGRANTFFKKYDSITSLKQWFIDTFFPILITNDDVKVDLTYNHDNVIISKGSIESETEIKPFNLVLEEEKNYDFKLWLIKDDKPLVGDNPIECFARNLRAALNNGKLIYNLDSEAGYKFYLTSDYFDENVDNKGEQIDISTESIGKINEAINTILDEKFQNVIENNRKATKTNYRNFKKLYPSLDVFIQEESFEDCKGVVDEESLVKSAIDTKGRIEKKFWTRMNKEDGTEEKPFDETTEGQKLLNSSLHIYIKHRENVLNRLKELIRPLDEDGADKPELESKIQELLFRRGTTLKDSDNINHLHNLWILDDKFTTFSKTQNGISTKNGQEASDIYIWADDMDELKQILILELKSTTKAHNAGDLKEGMIGQVKRYAKQFYNAPKKILNWDVDTSKVQYLGIVLASRADIRKELTSSTSGDYDPIPFLPNSYYKDDRFAISDDPRNKVSIRIELYSYEDIHKLASNRNEVFFRLLKREYELGEGPDE